jgi:hypothetical protein
MVMTAVDLNSNQYVFIDVSSYAFYALFLATLSCLSLLIVYLSQATLYQTKKKPRLQKGW